MSTPRPPQELFELWRKSLEEGTRAWTQAMGGRTPPAAPPGVDFAEFWRPLWTQGMEMWQKAAAQGAITPEFMNQWKSFMDQWIEAWSQGMERAMGTEWFAQALGRHLDQLLTAQGPLKSGLEQYTDQALRTLGLPSRGQVVSLAQQVIALEERIEGIEDRLGELRSLLRDVLQVLARREEAAQRTAGPGPSA